MSTAPTCAFRSIAATTGLSLLSALAMPSPAQAATRTIANCNDSGAGSLRAAIAASASGDVVDLRNLACPRITLTSGQIVVPQADLALLGPGRFALTIDGNQQSRVFSHTGTGRLFIDRVSIANGNVESGNEPVSGGCILSAGTVELSRSRVHHCRVWADDFQELVTAGGGVQARTVVLDRSSVFYNVAGRNGHGGGISATTVSLYRSQVYGNVVEGSGGGIIGGTVSATYSLIHGNRANHGGGIRAGQVTINKSTISANRALERPFLGPMQSGEGGILTTSADARNVIVDSTISGNTAYEYSAGRFAGDLVVFNSTITDNLEDMPDFADGGVCTGVGALQAPLLRLESSIVAGNRCILPTPFDIAPGTTIVGSDNLIGRSAVPVPGDTIAANPRLAPLADNGGPTRTHLPLADSPVLDRGSNLLHRQYDQGGPGFPRMKGAGPDIGAVER